MLNEKKSQGGLVCKDHSPDRGFDILTSPTIASIGNDPAHYHNRYYSNEKSNGVIWGIGLIINRITF